MYSVQNLLVQCPEDLRLPQTGHLSSADLAL